MARNTKTGSIYCSFCGKSQDVVKRIISGQKAYICNECIELCNEILEDDLRSEEIRSPKKDILKPREIKEKLDEYVVGQDMAKKALSVAVYNHYKRINSSSDDGVEIQKSNILRLGATGSGKTYLAQTIARILDVPFAIADATALTEAGYVGEDVENVLLKLIQNADFDIERAEKGIIYIDEVDKISRKGENTSITRDVSGEGVQQALLKIIEGTVANVPPQGGRKHPHQEFLQIDTSNILFICGGAFDGIQNIISDRASTRRSFGFSVDAQSNVTELTESNIIHKVLPGDLVKYGLIPEFVGRIPIITTLDELNRESLVKIMTEPKNALVKQYQKLFQLDGVQLEIAPSAVEAIAEKALERKMGARGLRAIMEETMMDIMYDVPSKRNVKKCIVDKSVVDKTGEVIIEFTKKDKSA